MVGTSGKARRTSRTMVACVVAVALLCIGLAWWMSGDAPTDLGRSSPLRSAERAADHADLPFTDAGQHAPESATGSLPKLSPAPTQALTASSGSAAPWARLIGRVLRPDGTPAADVNVVHPLQPGVNLAGQLRDNPPRTAADGSFEIGIGQTGTAPGASLMLLDGPPASRVLVHVPAPHAGDNDLGDVVLADGAGLSGRIVDPDGLPVARAYVTVRAPSDRDNGGELFDGNPDDVAWQNLAAAFTSDDGRFLLTGLPAAEMELYARADGFQEYTLRGLAPRRAELTELGDLALSEGRVLSGVLLDADGAPVAGRQVMAWAERSFPRGSTEARVDLGRTSGFTLSDALGGFRIAGLQPGVYELDAWAEGHAFTRLHDVADEQRDVVLRLRRAGRVLLTLRDARTQAPLGAAEVEASMAPRTGGGYSSDNAYVVTAGADAGFAEGMYVVDGLGDDTTILSVSREGYSPSSATIEGLAPGQQRELLLDLAPRVVLSGVVQDQFEQPVAGAMVQAGAHAGPATGTPTRMRRPPEDGRFRFDDLAIGSWQVWAYAPGHGKADNYAVEIPPEGLSDVIVFLPVLGRAAGLVTASDGTAMPGASVVAAEVEAMPLRGAPPHAGRIVIGPRDSHEKGAAATCDADGRFVVDGLWPGTWLMAATLGPPAEARARLASLAAAEAAALASPGRPLAVVGADVRRVTIVDGEATSADLVVPVPAQLRGRALSDGRPIAGARVVLGALNGDSATVLASTDTDADGGFEFSPVAPGQCVVMASSPDEIVPRGRRVALHDGEQAYVELSFHGPTLHGVVVDESSGRPVGDVDVSAYASKLYAGDGLTLADLDQKAMQVLSSAGLRGTTFRADAQGRFEIPHLPPGQWVCFAEGDRWLPADNVRVELPDDWTPDSIKLPVTAGALVQGSIRYAFGGGWPPSVEVQLYAPERDGIVKLDHPRDGHYLIGGVTPGTYELRLRDLQPGKNAPYVVAVPVTLAAGAVVTVDLIYEDS